MGVGVVFPNNGGHIVTTEEMAEKVFLLYILNTHVFAINLVEHAYSLYSYNIARS